MFIQKLLLSSLLILSTAQASTCKDWIKYKSDSDFQFLKRSQNYWWPNHQLITRELNKKEAPFLSYPNGVFLRSQSGIYLYPSQNMLFASHSKAMNYPDNNPLKRENNFFYANGRPARLNGKLLTIDGNPTNRESIKIRAEFADGILNLELKEKEERVILEIPAMNITAIKNGDGFDTKILLPTERPEEIVIFQMSTVGLVTCETP